MPPSQPSHANANTPPQLPFDIRLIGDSNAGNVSSTSVWPHPLAPSPNSDAAGEIHIPKHWPFV
ncbi:hypothetical protein [Synechococcus sp. PCC 7336]|uniref:hypothetical protein n=1 Tax=Synechococcus sp. PCC 7336 TaxID=195250 RepID=UPI0012E9B129|nr:hypothetical protein [Synechococcus sp. PCC 7336]